MLCHLNALNRTGPHKVSHSITNQNIFLFNLIRLLRSNSIFCQFLTDSAKILILQMLSSMQSVKNSINIQLDLIKLDYSIIIQHFLLNIIRLLIVSFNRNNRFWQNLNIAKVFILATCLKWHKRHN